MVIAKVLTSTIRVLSVTLLTISLGVTGNIAFADMKTDELVKQRQDLMKRMGGTFKVIVPILKGKNANVGDAIPAAMTVLEAAKGIVAAFPPGSGREMSDKTRAKPEVWSKRAEFEAAANKLAQESAKLVDAAKTKDVNKFRAQFKPYVASCGGCHKGPVKEGGKFRFAKE